MRTEEKTKQKKTQEKRSLLLLALFVDGYAAGWKMAVEECHKEALDIRMTERLYDGETTREWTQGSLFSFKEGSIFYDTPIATSYGVTWGEALTHIKLSVQILEALPAESQNKRGEVTFSASRPDEKAKQLNEFDKFKTTQDEFIRFLQTGIFHPLKVQPNGKSKLSSEIINLLATEQ